jgi:hypothetical protein
VGRFSVDFMAQKRKVTILPRLHGILNILVKAIQMVKETLQLFRSVWPDDKGVTNITKPAQRLWVACFRFRSFKSPIKKLELTGKAGNP